MTRPPGWIGTGKCQPSSYLTRPNPSPAPAGSFPPPPATPALQSASSVGYTNFDNLPFGALLSVHDLRDCVPSEVAQVGIAGLSPNRFETMEAYSQALAQAQLELVCGNYAAGRYAFHMPVIKRFEQPIPFVYPLKGPSKFFWVPLTPQIYKNYGTEDRMKYQLELKKRQASGNPS